MQIFKYKPPKDIHLFIPRAGQPAPVDPADRGEAPARRRLRAGHRGEEGDDQGEIPQHIQEEVVKRIRLKHECELLNVSRAAQRQ